MSLPTLPEIAFAELSPAEVESRVITAYEGLAGKTLYPGDPVRLFLESLAYIVALQNAALDYAGRQNLLAFAEGDVLDYLGDFVGTSRLAPSVSRTTLRYTLQEALDFVVPIDQGSRVTTGTGGLVFATEIGAEIPVGEISVDIAAVCTEAGARGNGLVPGQVATMVDEIPYVRGAANITATALGADREDNDRYKARIRLAPEHFSCAGSEDAYRYHTLSAHQLIVDCAIWRPVPGTVDVRPVMAAGELPPPPLLDMVRERLSAKTVRPLTDTVIVAAPDPVEYAISVGWTLQRDNAALAESIAAQVAAAVEEYRLWQRTLPGRDVNPTRLVALMERAGARRVMVSSPSYTVLADYQIARETAINIEYLGIEDE